MSWFLSSTLGKAVVFYVDLICGVVDRALYLFEEDDDD